MDLLETILRACDAEQHTDKFKSNGVDSYLLKVLVDEDLQALGIEDQATRARILNHCSTLQIPTEKRRDLTVDKQYLEFALTNIKVQLNKHLGNLSFALHKDNVDLCYIKLGAATQCLCNCVKELENEMVGWSESHQHLSQFDFMVAGGASGFITRAICQPLDVLKIRFQLQVEPISHQTHAAKYRSISQAVWLIFHEEGPKAFWKGHVPAQWLSISYGVAQFWSYEILTRHAHKVNFPSSVSPLVTFVCGSLAGSFATVVSFPFDVVRTRFVAQSEHHKVYHSMASAVKQICTTESPIVLFRGLWPTVLQIGPHAGAQFMCYRFFDDLYKRLMSADNTTLPSSLFAGSLAGLCAKTAIYPFDLVKKRLQIQGFGHARTHFGEHFSCRGLFDCLKRVYRLEGYRGFFKGLSPSLIKAVCATALHFSSYEMICELLLYLKKN